jgi:hypothetical protein
LKEQITEFDMGLSDARIPLAPEQTPNRATGGSPIQFLITRAPTHGSAVGFVRVPAYLLHGEVLAMLERTCPGLSALVLVLLRYADRREHVVRPSKKTLCRECGLGDHRTLDRRLAVLCTGNKRTGLPPVLRKWPGTEGNYMFREEGLATLAAYAQQNLTRQQEKYAAIRRAQGLGGRKGMASRWGRTPAARARPSESLGNAVGTSSSISGEGVPRIGQPFPISRKGIPRVRA